MLKGITYIRAINKYFIMNRNWIVLVFALLALASCSVEKRVYQPGFHFEWNHFAAQGHSEGASQDLPQDLSKKLEIDVSQGASHDLPHDLSKNLEIDVSQGDSQDLPQDLSKNLFQDASQDVSQGATQDLPQDLSENLETDVSQARSQSKHSDFELILFILLALFLPALTIFLLEGFSKNFWIALLLMICAFSLPFLAVIVRSILEIIAIILAISVVLHYM